MRFRLRLTGLKRSAPSCKHGSHPFFNPAPCLLQVLESPPSQLAVGNCMYSEWHLDIGKLCFIFTKILCILAKQQAIDIDSCYVEGIRNKEFRYPRRASHNTVNALEMERHFAIILVMQSDRDLRHTIQVEKHSGKGRRRLGAQASWEGYDAIPTISLPRWRRRASRLRFSMAYTALQISSVSTSSDSIKIAVSSRQPHRQIPIEQ